MRKNKKLAKALNKWLKCNEELRKINSYLYEHTELFEQDNMFDYNDELYAFFAGKITRFTREQNELYDKVTTNFAIFMKEVELFGGE